MLAILSYILIVRISLILVMLKTDYSFSQASMWKAMIPPTLISMAHKLGLEPFITTRDMMRPYFMIQTIVLDEKWRIGISKRMKNSIDPLLIGGTIYTNQAESSKRIVQFYQNLYAEQFSGWPFLLFHWGGHG